MQGTIHRSLRTGLFGVGWALVTATASAGPIILGGDDLTHHGTTSAGQMFDGWLYIQRALENIAPAVTIANNGSVAVLGSADSMATTNNAGAAYHFAVPLAAATTPLSGVIDFRDGPTAINQFFTDLMNGTVTPAIIVTAGEGANNDLDATEGTALTNNAINIANFVNGGGGLISHGAEPPNAIIAYGWLSVLLPNLLVVNSGCVPPLCDDLALTPAGMTVFPGITNANINAGPWHNHFEPQSALGGLNILAIDTNDNDSQGLPRAVIIGGEVNLPGQIDLSPDVSFNPPGGQHQITTNFVDASGNPLVGEIVSFLVTSGPNMGTLGADLTDLNGNALFNYASNGLIGMDEIRGSAIDPATGQTLQETVRKYWDTDCQPDGIPDSCNLDCGFGLCGQDFIACGGSTDDNGDGVPDECVPGIIIFVDGTCGDDTFSGSDSSCAAPPPTGPKRTIQAAITAALSGDEVVIAPGTYPETIDFLGKAITVRSSGGAAVTTIDGQGSGPVVTCANGEGPNAVLFDLTITGGSAFKGAGMSNLDSSPTVINCIFRGNTAPGTGGGMYNLRGNPSVSNCTFGGNTASTGGGMANDMSDPVVTNCVFAGNSANFGGAVHNLASNPTLTNCTFNRNSAGNGGGAIYGGAVSGLLVRNSILWNSSPDAVGSDGTGTITVIFCNVQGGFPGGGNINALPLFADATGPDDIPGTADDDLRLLFPSPCIDVALNAAFTSCLPDRAGNERFVDEPLIPDCPVCGAPPVIDMGAYEFGGTPTLDCNTNGLIDICEITTMLAPDCNDNGIPDECDIADGTSQDCNGNFIPDTCDIDSGLSIDCDGNLVPDECEVLFLIAESPQLSPVGAGAPQSFTIPNAPDSGGCVTLSFEAIGDLGGTVEFVDVDINGTAVGTVYVHARDCPAQPSSDEILVSPAVYNAAITSDAVINMVASPQVDPNQCPSFISVTVSYQAVTAADQNGNGIPDDCECPLDLDGSGSVDVPDLLQLLAAWGLDPSGPPDFDGDGEVAVPDLLALLANWGSSCS